MNREATPHDVYSRLGTVLRERRLELGLKQTELKQHGGPSPETVVKFEKGDVSGNVQPRTLDGFDRALQWKQGSTKAVMDGGDPTPLFVSSSPDRAATGHHGKQELQKVWIPVPRCIIQDLIIAASRVSVMARVAPGKENAELPDDLREAIRHVYVLTADMSALLASSDRGFVDLESLMDSNTPLHPYGFRGENFGSTVSFEHGDVEG